MKKKINMRFEQVQLEHEQINKATFITITCISMPIQCITNGRRFLPWASGGDTFYKHLFIDWIELYVYPFGIYSIFFISIVRIYLYELRVVNIVTSSRIEQNQTESFRNSANNFKTKHNQTNHIKMCYVFFSSCNLILGSDEMVILKCLITYVRYPNEVILTMQTKSSKNFILVGLWQRILKYFCVCNNNLYKSKWRKKKK